MNWTEYVSTNSDAAHALDKSKLEDVVRVLTSVRDEGSKVWILGNGGSASTASHAVGDFAKTTKTLGGKPLFAIAPSEMTALQTAYANDIDFSEGFAHTLEDFLEPGDAVWVISVSGKSPNLLRAVDVARSREARIIATVGNQGKALEGLSLCITIPSDDYQIVENIQVQIMHWLTKQLASN